ncbi:MAG: MgtC/SapB transporter [Candidatus Yanofskybacteria bacterium GW2011_GWA1_41_6]|uniref:MgtC/SapB transporter n=1 Tax=Candidatus Yanofskybacteria bacterium GW2011_GWA1_41_6 TaxID=1619020 RepID=A0A0G0WIR4_9BACT|nr:MAG: MgtC/SapB transporter [Candidatus Yanofskybacteria bacterium GW2011_GWA1_41_6]
MIQLTQFLTYLDWEMISRLLVAALLGGAVGFERERSGKVAGLRTHTLVSIGAALLSVISIKLFQVFPSVNGTVGYDYHLIANIVVGIGFIGAGTILRRENRIEGTTTAASLWVVSAIGIASGFGFYQEAVSTTVVVYVVLAGLWLVEKYLTHDIRYKGQGIFGELKQSENPGPKFTEK